MKHPLNRLWCGLLLALPAVVSANPGEAMFVAERQRTARPVDAPVISQYNKSREWYENALRGVSKPYPRTLVFLENQGAWYTPFTQAGMPGYYDIRAMHRQMHVSGNTDMRSGRMDGSMSGMTGMPGMSGMQGMGAK